jgi:hypothetical protein
MPATINRQPSAETTAHIEQSLRAHERRFRLGIIALLIGGAALALVGPIIVGSLVFLKQFRRGHVASMSWFAAVGITAFFVVPLIFAIEFATGGKFIDDFAETMADRPFTVRRAGSGAVFLEVFLWGPRMIIAAFRRVSGINACKGHDRALAAAMLGKLLMRDESMPAGEVFDATNPAAVASLTYLTFYDWIDISKAGDRIWILSEARKRLTR